MKTKKEKSSSWKYLWTTLHAYVESLFCQGEVTITDKSKIKHYFAKKENNKLKVVCYEEKADYDNIILGFWDPSKIQRGYKTVEIIGIDKTDVNKIPAISGETPVYIEKLPEVNIEIALLDQGSYYMEDPEFFGKVNKRDSYSLGIPRSSSEERLEIIRGIIR